MFDSNYTNRVSDGFCIAIDGLGVVFAWICTSIFIVFGWPFALLGWISEESTTEPLIITYTILLSKYQDANAKEVREFLEQHKHDKAFILRAEALNRLKAGCQRQYAKTEEGETINCLHCNGKVEIYKDKWMWCRCGGVAIYEPLYNRTATTEKGRSENRTMKCWHCYGKVQVLKDGWICRECGQHGAPFTEPAMTIEEGRLENKPWQALGLLHREKEKTRELRAAQTPE